MVTRSLGPALLLALSVLACSGGAGEDTPDAESRALVLIVIDTLRGDRIGCMGSSVARTPHLDALAARGVRFSQAMTPVPVTLPAVASLLTGRLPMQHGVRDNEKFVLRSGEVTLAERFREAGWRTAAVVASSVLSRDRGLAEGFETYDDDFKGPYPVYNPKHKFANLKYATTRRRADTVTNLAVDAVRGFAGDPFFLFLHYFDVHTIYDPPPPYSSWHPGRAYDAEVSFVDAEIGRFLVTLQRERPDATVMVVSDHGEGLGEHGETLHGFLLYESTLHVVSIVAGPGLPQGAVREDPISLVDVEPTLAGWFGLPSVQPERDGRALSRDTPETDPAPLYAETMRTLVSYGWSELRAIRKGPHKAIFGPENELYDLSVDPAEVEDLGSVPPMDTLRGELETLIGAETRERVLASAVSDPDPERTEVLASLGYIGETETAKPSAQGSFPHPRDELEKWVQRQKNKDRVRAAALRLDAGDVQEAMEHFNTVLENEPDNTDALAGRGLARTRSGDAGGWADIERTLEIKPDHVLALTLTAIREEERGEITLALEYWRQVLEAEHPTGVSPFMALLDRSSASDDLTNHAATVRREAQARPSDPVAQLDLGIVECRLGRPQPGETAFRAFLDLTRDEEAYVTTRAAILDRFGAGRTP